MLKKIKQPAILSLLIFFASCAGYDVQKTRIAIGLEQNLTRSDNALEASTRILMNSLMEKSQDPRTAERAALWLAKAGKIKYISDSTDGVIILLKEKLKEKAGNKKWDEQQERGDHFTAVKDLFQKESKEAMLQELMKKYYEPQLLAVDPEIKATFEKNMATINISPRINTAYDINFSGASYAEAFLLLTRIQNNIRLNENAMIGFCHNKIGSTDGCGFTDRIGILVSQSANIVKPGDHISITAGIGSFSAAARPLITIAGMNVPVTDGRSTYTFKAPAQNGKHTVKVSIQFTDENGNQKIIAQYVTYDVQQCREK